MTFNPWEQAVDARGPQGAMLAGSRGILGG